MSLWRILTGDVRQMLATLTAESVQTCVTSPPYWGLRDYGVSGQLGLEETPEAYVAAMVEVFREVRRVLRDDGTLWLNLGDSYHGGGNYRGVNSEATLSAKQMSNGGARGVSQLLGSRGKIDGLKDKDLVGIPWMVAFALRADGWYLRSDIIWSKPNPMPESVTDRPTKAHEYIFLLSKSRSYYYDADAVQEPIAPSQVGRVRADVVGGKSHAERGQHSRGGTFKQDGHGRRHAGLNARWDDSDADERDTRNKRSVWTVTTQPYPEAHFATYPEKLIEPCILAGSKEGDTVLDPFTGSGTTGAVAVRHQRHFVGCELNPAYVELARKRIGNVAPLLAREVA